MSFDALLVHTCDIYHIVNNSLPVGYGLPLDTQFGYPSEPDIKNIPCHFNTRDGVAGVPSLKQNKPYASYEARIKLILPIGTDVRLNDKVVNRGNGYEYTAEIPRNIHGHHMFVYLRRMGSQKPV